MTGRPNICRLSVEGSTPRFFVPDDFYWVARSAYPALVLSVTLYVSGCGYFDHTQKYPCAADFALCTDDEKAGYCSNFPAEPDCVQFCSNNPTICITGDSANPVGTGDGVTGPSGVAGDSTQSGGSKNTVATGGSGGNGAGMAAGGNQNATGAGGVGPNLTGGAGPAETGGTGGTQEPTGCVNDDTCSERVCDTSNAVCVPCLLDKGCPNDAPICKEGNTSLENVCVACLEGKGCSGETRWCLENEAADDTKNVCVKCTEDKHCASGVCDPAIHECVPCRKDGTKSVGCSDPTPVCKDDPSNPLTNQCVECVDNSGCSGKEPICGADNACRRCEAHSECDSVGGGVCNWDTGECLSDNAIIHVGTTNPPCVNTSGGTKNRPWCSLQTAVERVSSTKTTILVNPGIYDSIQIKDETDPVWIVGKDKAIISTQTTDQANVYIQGNSKVTLEHLTIADALVTGVGINCVATDYTPILTVRGCTITGNTGGGVLLSSCGFNMTSNVIAANGSGKSTFGGVWITSAGSPAIFLNNTVAYNVSPSDTTAGIWCNASCSSVSLRNTISYKNNNGDLSSGLVPQYSWIYDGTSVSVGSGNLKGNACALEADYGLPKTDPKSLCIDAGDTGTRYDLKYNVDIDGQNRVQGAGPDIGADEES